MSTKGKSRNRTGGRNILRSNQKIAAKKPREQARAKGYDRKSYDGNSSEES
jgi:hypothetical protein